MHLRELARMATLTLLAGCTAVQVPDDVSDNVSEVAANIDSLKRFRPAHPNVFLFEQIYVEDLTQEEASRPDWYFAEFPSVVDTSLDEAMTDLSQALYINVDYLSGVDKSRRVYFAQKNATVGEYIEAVASQTGLSFELTPTQILWSRLVTETFHLPIFSGRTDFSLGKKEFQGQEQKSQNQENADSDLVNSTGEEFSTVSDNFNKMEEYLSGVELILGCGKYATDHLQEAPAKQIIPVSTNNGQNHNDSGLTSALDRYRQTINADVSVSTSNNQKMQGQDGEFIGCDKGAFAQLKKADNTILVKATPAQMEMVREFIADKERFENRFARIYITIMNVDVTNEDLYRVDLNLIDEAIHNSTRLGLTAVTNAAGSVVGGLTSPGSASLVYQNSTESASSVAIEALKEQADILQSKTISGILSNNTVTQLTRINKVSYVARRELQQSNSIGVGVTSAIQQAVAKSGELAYIRANIGETHVRLHLSISQSSLTRLETKGEGLQQVESPEIDDMFYNFKMRVRPGVPILVSGFDSTEKQAVDAISGPLPGATKSASNRRAQTVMMVEVEYIND